MVGFTRQIASRRVSGGRPDGAFLLVGEFVFFDKRPMAASVSPLVGRSGHGFAGRGFVGGDLVRIAGRL